ncbi:MAG: hypothetical protein GX492_12155 [Firmicutes bacterium]|nr:hypothetical protein [Bacillota bacterium]
MNIIIQRRAIWITGNPREILWALALLARDHTTLGDLLASPAERPDR